MATTRITTQGYVDDTTAFGGMLYDAMEYVVDLTWPESVTTYNKMRRDPQLAAILQAHTLPLRRARWAVDPTGCRPEVARLVADDLGLPLVGKDEPGPARTRGVTWDQHLRLALLKLTYGHMPFSLTVDIVDDRARLTGLYERMPQTIAEIRTDQSTGALVGFKQHQPVGVPGPTGFIKAENCVWYAHDREGQGWYGTSLLRPAFGPWLVKHEMWRVHGQSNRRNGMGHPVMEALPGTTPSPGQMTEAQAMAAAHRAGDQSGAATPPGFRFRLVGVEGALPDTLAFIRYLDQQMSRMVLAGMLDLGDTPNGSRALGAEFVDLFMLSLQAIGDETAEQATTVARRLVDLNWGEDEDVPQVVVDGVGEDDQVTAAALAQLVTSGALAADPELEAWLRRRYGLPERSRAIPPTTPPRPAPEAPPGEPPEQPDQPPVAAKRAAPFRRALTARERHTDFVAIAAERHAAAADLADAWQAVTSTWASLLHTQVEDLARLNDPAAFARSLTLAGAPGHAVLQDHLQRAAVQAAGRMQREIEAQGRTAPTLLAVGVGDLVAVTLARLAAQVTARATRQALNAWGQPPARVADAAVKDLAPSLATFDGIVHGAQHHGRMATLRTPEVQAQTVDEGFGPSAVYVASEVMDTNTCGPCAAIDGTIFPDVDAANEAYPTGQYIDCEGWDRCRGTLIVTWPDEAPPVQEPVETPPAEPLPEGWSQVTDNLATREGAMVSTDQGVIPPDLLRYIDDLLAAHPYDTPGESLLVTLHSDWHAGLAGATSKVMPHIQLNRGLFTDENVRAYWRTKSIQGEVMPSCATDPARYALLHEYGHVLDYQAGMVAPGTGVETATQVRLAELMHRASGDLQQALLADASTYATGPLASESIAEGFAEYAMTNGETTNMWARMCAGLLLGGG